MSKQQMISCLSWIPRGAAKTLPELYEMPDEAVQELAVSNSELSIHEEEVKFMASQEDELSKSQSDKKSKKGQKVLVSKKLAKKKAQQANMNDSDGRDVDGDDDDSEGSDLEDATTDRDEILKRLNLDEYDDDAEEEEHGGDEDDNEDDTDLEEDDEAGENGARYLGGTALTPFMDPTQDPYLTHLDDEEDMEEQMIKNTDSCILAGSTSEGDSSIEVYIFDEKTSNLYVHHEIVLPSFPLCIQWINANPRASMIDSTTGEYFPPTGSFAAVGTFQTGIEIWNCDVMNPLEPVTILGGEEGLVSLTHPVGVKVPVTKKFGKRLSKPVMKPSKKLRKGSHTDAVMSLAWHHEIPARLASGSADKMVKLWDVTTQQCVYTASHHRDKVQSLSWHSTQLDVLLTGGYDRRVCVVDTRISEAEVSKLKPLYTLSGDVEMVKWNPADENQFVATAEDGTVVCLDVRSKNSKENIWKIQAHEKACSSITFNSAVPTMFATASVDKTVRIWDSAQLIERKDFFGNGKVPELLATRDLKVGKIFTMQFDVSNPFVLAAGGDEGCLAIWDTLENVRINERYGRVAENIGLGPQDLPEDYVEFQRTGGLSKGVGPGLEAKDDFENGDANSEDEGDLRMMSDEFKSEEVFDEEVEE